MYASGISVNIQQQSAGSDDPNIIIMGPSGQIQMGDGGISDVPLPDTVPPNESRPSTSPDLLTTAVPVTQVSPSLPTSAPVFSSQDLPPQSVVEGTTTLSVSLVSTTPTISLDSSTVNSPTTTASAISIKEPSASSSSYLESSTTTSSVSWTLASSQMSSTSLASPLPSTPTSRTSSLHISSSTIVQSRNAASSSTSPSSQAHDTSSSSESSTSASSTASEQIPAETVIAPPLPTNAHNLSAHNPPFYVGIALGTIAGIAILAALIAWWIRLLAHRRRTARTVVPWGRSEDDDDDSGLEAGHRGPEVDSSAIGAMNLGSREDLAHVQAWSPRGDRDVGEPKRADGVQGSAYSLHDHPIPGHNLFLDQPAQDGRLDSGLRPKQTLRHLPSHLIDENFADCARHGDGSEMSSYTGRPLSLQSGVSTGPNQGYGTLRESAIKPRYLDVERTLDDSWGQPPAAPPRSMVDRLRGLGKSPTDAPWEELGPLPNPNGEKDEAEPWGASFKTSLLSAFNSVASNISGAPRMDDDKLTAPPKRTTRKSIQDTVWEEKKSDGDDLCRKSSTSTTLSKPWSLEETRDGAGIVHLHIPDHTGYQSFRPSIPGSTLSFGDGDSISTGDGCDPDFYHVRTGESQVPLIASSAPQRAVTRTDQSSFSRNSKEIVSGVSRNSSMYSTLSAYPDWQERLRRKENAFDLPPISSEALQAQHLTNEVCGHEGELADSVVIQPDNISRLSSSDSSILSTGDGAKSNSDLAAVRALKERQSGIS